MRRNLDQLLPLAGFAKEIGATGLAVHPVTVEVCALAAELPADFPADPGDRLIAATAIALACPLVSSDERLAAAPALELVR